ncbi:MAG: hypothetical protein U5J63_11990 [Fodinibius sp.]|nr:hypothetical protein [Fodinibius sp.]
MDEDIEHRLPGVITSIRVQKNNKERYSIFVDEEFLLGVAEQTLLKFSLSKGDEITSAQLSKNQARKRDDLRSNRT